MVGTKKAKEVKKYYIELEKIFKLYSEYQNKYKDNQLLLSEEKISYQEKLIEDEKEKSHILENQIREGKILQIDGKIYLASTIDYDSENLIKYGITKENNINIRIKKYHVGIVNSKKYYCKKYIECHNPKLLEDIISDLLISYRIKDNKTNKLTEMINLPYDKLEKIFDYICDNYNKSVEYVNNFIKNNNLEIKENINEEIKEEVNEEIKENINEEIKEEVNEEIKEVKEITKDLNIIKNLKVISNETNEDLNNIFKIFNIEFNFEELKYNTNIIYLTKEEIKEEYYKYFTKLHNKDEKRHEYLNKILKLYNFKIKDKRFEIKNELGHIIQKIRKYYLCFNYSNIKYTKDDYKLLENNNILDNIELININKIFKNNKILEEELRNGFDNLYRKNVGSDKYKTIDNINQYLNNILQKYNKKIKNKRVQKNNKKYKLYELINI
jgi:hypothetical protein